MNADFGRVPPQSIQAEESVLGAIMVNPESLDEIIAFINPEMFYKDANQIIYRAILDVNASGLKPDILAINNRIAALNQESATGGIAYLISLTEKIVTDKLIVQHALIVKESFIRREYIRVCSDIINRSFDTSNEFEDIVNYTEQSLYELTDQSIQVDPEALREIYKETLQTIEIIEKQKKELVGVPSGITDLDRITLGWQKSDFILIAARPSMGKTAFALFCAMNAASLGYNVLFFSLEMSKRQLSYRLLSDNKNRSVDLKAGKNIDWESLESRAGGEYASKIFIDDTPALKTTEIRSIVRKFKKKMQIDAVFIDYLQLAKGDERLIRNNNQYVGTISEAFKSIAKEMDVPVIALSQLNRSVESRSNPLPILSDLRDSGSLEQDADIVVFLTRIARLPERYHFSDEGEDVRHKGYIDVQKNRNGACETLFVNVTQDAMNWGYQDESEGIF